MNKRIIFQGITDNNHVDNLHEILSIDNPKKVIFSVAFINKGGVSQISSKLKNIGAKPTVYAGVRNGITSGQGFQDAFDLGCDVYAVDTGARSVIFHPKIYFSRNDGFARLMVGSANLTVGGLRTNIESSVYMELDLSVNQDAQIAKSIEDTLAGLPVDHPKNVALINSVDEIQEMITAGRLIDESVVTAPVATGFSKNREFDTVPRMKLKSPKPQKTKIKPLSNKKKVSSPLPAGGIHSPQSTSLNLVWESSPLTRRDLNIPTGKSTNRTGSMLLKKGVLDEVDQRHYFRDEVFDGLNWAYDTAKNKGHIERAEAQFSIVIKGVDYGVFTLKLSHNTDVNSKTYAQKNSMTNLHWGNAVDLVAKEDLLNRTMSLYRNPVTANSFVIEID